jgi:hypothetical protein
LEDETYHDIITIHQPRPSEGGTGGDRDHLLYMVPKTLSGIDVRGALESLILKLDMFLLDFSFKNMKPICTYF